MIKEILTKWETDIKRSEDFLRESAALLGDGNAVEEEINLLQCALTDSVSDYIGDKCQVLNWYWLDNHFGAKGLEAGINGEFSEIKNIDDLVATINKVNSHNLTVTKWKV